MGPRLSRVLRRLQRLQLLRRLLVLQRLVCLLWRPLVLRRLVFLLWRLVFVLRRRRVHRRLQLPGLLGLLRLCQRLRLLRLLLLLRRAWSSGYSCCGGGWYRSAAGWVSVVAPGGVVVAPGTAAPPPMPKLPEPVEKQAATAPAPATVVIKAPMDVRITVNGQPTDRQSAEQIFTTPDLQPGITYSYDFRAEAVRGGKTVTRTQTVIVKAGQESQADFGDLTAADAPAHVTITAPADARMTVDGVEIPGFVAHLHHAGAGGGADVLLHGDGGDDARRPQGQRQPARAGLGWRRRAVEFTEAGVTTAGK